MLYCFFIILACSCRYPSTWGDVDFALSSILIPKSRFWPDIGKCLKNANKMKTCFVQKWFDFFRSENKLLPDTKPSGLRPFHFRPGFKANHF